MSGRDFDMHYRKYNDDLIDHDRPPLPNAFVTTHTRQTNFEGESVYNRIMAKKTSKSAAAAAPPKASNVDIDIDDIFSGKPLKPSAQASSSSVKTQSGETTSTSSNKKKNKKRKALEGDVDQEVESGNVKGVVQTTEGQGKRKADTFTEVPKSKKSKTKGSKASKSHDDYEEGDEDEDESVSQVVEVSDPSAVSRTKVKAALQPPRGRREVDADEEMFRDSRGDGPST